MDEIADHPFARLPMRALSLRLTRAVIPMRHGPEWRIDKTNPDHDLLIGLTGRGRYVLAAGEITLEPGEAMLIPAHQRFRGHHDGGDALYTGIAQHFTIDLFGRGDAIGQMTLRPKVRLTDWATLKPLAHDYYDPAPGAATTLARHHHFMVLLLAYLGDAFVDWRGDETLGGQDRLSRQILFVAARLTVDPRARAVDHILDAVPYNAAYFRRAFRERIGQTPQKYRESKRMEFAVHRLGQGATVKEVAAELGYADPLYFSRMFKRHIGASPQRYRVASNRTAQNAP